MAYIKKYLDIQVLDDKTTLKYCNDENVCFMYEYPVGLKKITEELLSKIIISDWISGIIYSLENISLTERVPTFIYLSTPIYGSVFEKVLKEKETYSQFYLENTDLGRGIHVIIKKIDYNTFPLNLRENKLEGSAKHNPSELEEKSYERYTKAISQFKI